MDVKAINASVPTFGAKLKNNGVTQELVDSMVLRELKAFKQGLEKLDKIQVGDTLEIVKQTKEEPSFFAKVCDKLGELKDGIFSKNEEKEERYLIVNTDRENTRPLDITPGEKWPKSLTGTVCDAIRFVGDGNAKEDGLLFIETEPEIESISDTPHKPGRYNGMEFDLYDRFHAKNEAENRKEYIENRTPEQEKQEEELRKQIYEMME